MREISDKELDGFFKSALEDFEVQPSAKTWDHIAKDLDKKPKTFKLPVFWMAAASVMVVLGVAVMLNQQPDEVIKLKPDGNPQIAKTQQPAPKPAQPATVLSADGEFINNDLPKASKTVKAGTDSYVAKPASKLNIEGDATKATSGNVLNVDNNNQQTTEQLAIQPVRKPTVTEKILAEEALKNKGNVEVPANVIYAQSSKTDENQTVVSATPERKLKIKSVNDLVNFMIAKVDKREEKIIKVSKTEESDTEITGINLGLIKFRKAEK